MTVTVNPNAVKSDPTEATGGGASEITDNRILGTLLGGLVSVTASAISATDTILAALAKLQANVDTKADALSVIQSLLLKQDKLPTNGLDGQFLAPDLTFKTPVGALPIINNIGCGFSVGKPLPQYGMGYFDNSHIGSATSSNVVFGANLSQTFPIVFNQDMTVSEIGMTVQNTFSGTPSIQLGIYSSHPDHQMPYALLLAPPTILISTTGYKGVSLLANFVFQKNVVYWIKVHNPSTTVSLRQIAFPLQFGMKSSNDDPSTIIQHVADTTARISPYFTSTPNSTGQQPEYPDPARMYAFQNVPRIVFKGVS